MPAPSWPSTAGKMPSGSSPREGEGIGVAYAGVGDLDQHLARLGRGDVDLDDLQGLSSLEGYGGAGFHGNALLWRMIGDMAGRAGPRMVQGP